MIRKTTLIVASLLSSVLACQSTHAEMPEVEAAHKPFKFLLGAGLTFGGEDLLGVEYENGISDELELGGLMDIKRGSDSSLQTLRWFCKVHLAITLTG